MSRIKSSKKIQKLLNNPIALFGGTILILVIVVILYLLLNPATEKPTILPGSVDQPISYEEDKDVEVPANIVIKNDLGDDTLPIFEIIKEDKVGGVQDFLVAAGHGFDKRISVEDIVYTWSENESGTLYVTEYNSIYDRVFFRFEDSVDFNISSGSILTESDMETFFVDFVHEVWNSDFEYINFNVSLEGNSYRVEANRAIGEYPLEVSGFESYSDYLVVDRDGKVSEGRFYLFEYDTDSAQYLDLLSIDLLDSVINRDDYPKEFNQLTPIGFEEAYPDLNPFQHEDGTTYGDVPAFDAISEMDDLDRCTTEKVSIVYLYFTNNYNELSPVYRLDCRGDIVFDGKVFETWAVIYASAIDPEYVYVPGTINVN